MAIAGIQTVFEGFSSNTQEDVRKNQLRYKLPITMGHDPGDAQTHKRPDTMQKYRSGGLTLAPILKWILPGAAIVGAVAYSLTIYFATDDAKLTVNTPNYELPPAALSTGQKQAMHVDDAFRLSLNADSTGVINARFDIAPNFYLYRSKIKIAGPAGYVLTPSFPASKTKRDEHFGDSEVFDQSFAFTVGVGADLKRPLAISATYQGCENEGICYPPVTKQFVVNAGVAQ